MSSEIESDIANRDALSSLERSLVDSVSLDEPWALLERFSDLERVSGTEDERAAADYICERLDALGVAYDRYEPELYISQPHDASVRVADADFEPGPVKTVAFSASDTVAGDLVYVGEADQSDVGADETESSQYHAVDISRPYRDVGDLDGKIALTAAGSLSIRATRVLEEKGAAAVVAIHQHEREPHSGIATSVWGGAPPLDEKDRIPSIPIANVRKPDGERLREYAETDGTNEVTVETDLTTDWMECPIVVADVEAGDATGDEFALLHGHYDSWFVGIADNGTGDAGLLELARIFDDHADDLQRDLRIAWWPGHSTGRYAGSTWYADEFALDLAENCVAHINMDSPGAKGSTEYTDMSCWMPEMHGVVSGAIEDVTGAPYRENRPRRAGDYSFNNLGLSGAFTLSSNIAADVRDTMGWHPVGGCGGNADAWHVSTDTIDKAGRPELRRDVRMYSVLLARLLAADVLPIDHRRTLANHAEVVEEYDGMAGSAFDFGPTLEALTVLREEVEAFYDAVDAGDVPPETANDAITDLSRVLTRLGFVSEGEFAQDPAYNRPPWPRYESTARFDEFDPSDDEHRFLALQLKREQNDAVNELRRARELLP